MAKLKVAPPAPPLPAKVVELHPKPKKGKFSLASRWSEALAAPEMLAATGGYVPVLRSFLQNYTAMTPPLTTPEAMLVLHLMGFKWTAEAPFPGYKTLGRLMGCSPKMVRRHAKALQSVGYLRREMRVGQTNRFHLDGLFRALEKHLGK
jgi:hypothetical protein